MGFNNENARRMVFDIETAPLTDAAAYLDLDAFQAPANYKDPIKIAEHIDGQKREALSKCSLDVDLCRVVAMAWQYDDGEFHVRTADSEERERAMLERFWVHADGHHLLGFNCLGFDLPVLLRRSLYLGVTPLEIQIDRFKHPQVTDVMDVLSFAGKLKLRGLSFYCRRFGIDVPDGLTGADIAEAVQDGRWADVELHVLADVRKTVALATRVGLFAREAAAVA